MNYFLDTSALVKLYHTEKGSEYLDTELSKHQDELIQQAMNALHTTLDPVEVERFIALLSREKFDYTEWRKNLWTDETIDSLSQKAQAYYEQRHPAKNATDSS